MKVLNIRIWQGGMLPLLLGGVIGCTPVNYLGLAQTPVTPIRELVNHKEPNAETIYVEGTVVDRAPFMDNGSYQLRDETGTVWVLTNGALPRSGDRIMIKGQVEYQSIPVGGQEVGELYILEVEQLTNQAQNPPPQAQPVSSPPTEPQSNPNPQPKPKPELNLNELLLPHKSNTK
ncbi:DNA-binding protein [Rippkaea orientalis]|nr:DNA-binding protein [Rippkaea orientalis]